MVENKINIEQVVNYLSHAFGKAASRAIQKVGSKAIRIENDDGSVDTSVLYDYQVEFCYLINEIQRGPSYIVPKIIQDTNDLISKLEREGV